MAGTGVAELNGFFKTVYAGKILDLVPDFAVLQKRVSFTESDKLGAKYAQPINLSQEHGFSYNGTAGAIATLNGAVSAQMEEAQVQGSELILRSQLSYAAVTRSANGGQASFKKATGWKVEEMNNSSRKRLELSMLYGQSGLATVSSNTAGVLLITDATWAPGIWAGAERAVLEAFTDTTTSATQHNTDLTISAVDTDAKTITVTGTSSAVVAGDILYFKGSRTASTFSEMAGLHKIITNTGTLFNISATTYSLWKGNTNTSTGVLSQAKIQAAVAKCVNKGLMEKVLVLVSPKAWASLNADMSALRVFDSSYSSAKMENGGESLVFHSTNGKLEVLAHPFVKEGDFFILPESLLKRVGSCDLTFSLSGTGEEFFLYVLGSNAIELQCMCDQAIFLEKPAHALYGSGVSY